MRGSLALASPITLKEVEIAMPRELLTELPENPSFEDFRRFDGTLYAKNHSINAVTASTWDNKFILNPSGSDGDCKPIPEHCFKLAGFQKAWMRGQISISPDYGDYSMQGMMRQDAFREKQIAEIQEMTEESSSKNDLLPAKCKVCGGPAFLLQSDLAEGKEPRCPSHRLESFTLAKNATQSS